jgi:3-deoxy-D-manno-octulosonate 8-phosphate phosphatase (KDO 8-P phosphatase)
VTPDLHQRAQAIRLLVLDVDGVLTDGRIYYGADGVELKAFNIQDGLGIKLLRTTGVEVAIITGRKSPAVTTRAAELGIVHLFQGAGDKLAAFEEILARLSIDAAAAAGMGDDLPDLPVLRRCGLAVCVPEAPPVMRRAAHYVTDRAGGTGAVREVCDLLMVAQGTFEQGMQEFMK